MDDVIAVVTDLFFQARINSAGKVAGRSVRFATSLPQVEATTGYRTALVDLDAHLDVEEAIASLATVGGREVIAFGPHLDTEKRKAARAAGARRVLAKSKFVTELPRIMGGSV